MELDTIIEVIQSYKAGKTIEWFNKLTNMWLTIGNGNFTGFNFSNEIYRIKPEITREEITSNWVLDNKVEAGNKVEIIGRNLSGVAVDDSFKRHATVYSIRDTYIVVSDGEWKEYFPIESLKVVIQEYTPFTADDYEMFIGKIIKNKNTPTTISMVTGCNEKFIFYGPELVDYECAFKFFEFNDGSVFGKFFKNK
jgi:hypothetical protein